MNQILATMTPEKRKTKNTKNKNNSYHQPADIKKVMMVFAIALIIFGICVIGSGSYAILKKQGTISKESKPIITTESITSASIALKVTHNEGIKEVTYTWNEEAEQTIQGNNQKYITQEIELPSGINTLYVRVTDVNGQIATFEKQYELENDINLEVIDNKIKVTYEGTTEIAYMTYRWDEEEEKRIEINNETVEEEIEVQRGTHTLTVVLVDINNKTETKEQQIKGVSKPKLDVTTDGESFIIKASDEIGLEKIDFVINEDPDKKFRVRTSEKEFEYKYPLEEGENKIEITAYNTDGMTTVTRVKFTK